MKKSIAVIAIALMASLCFLACSKQNAKKNYILATGGTGGTYYPFGGAIGNIWNTKIENAPIEMERSVKELYKKSALRALETVSYQD